MNFDELGHSWREQNAGSDGPDSIELLTSVVQRVERRRITNLILGTVGFILSLLVVYDFGKMALNEPSSFARVGATLCVLGALVGIVGMVYYSQWPNRSSSQSTCDYFSQELHRNDKLIAANKSPFTWGAMAVITVGACLMAVDLPTPRLILIIAFAIGINLVGLWAAWRTVSRAMTLRQDMELLLSDLREDPA